MLENIGNLLRHYHKSHGLILDDEKFPPIRTTLLRPFIEERGVVDKIVLFKANIETSGIVAQVQKLQGQTVPYSGILNLAHIYYAKNHNYCWRRFAVCKEMFHCMIDRTMDDRIVTFKSMETLLELLVTDTTAITGDFPPLDREQEAEILALETLFPMEFRQDYLERSAGNDEIERLAAQFRIPVYYVRLACHPRYNQRIIGRRGTLENFT